MRVGHVVTFNTCGLSNNHPPARSPPTRTLAHPLPACPPTRPPASSPTWIALFHLHGSRSLPHSLCLEPCAGAVVHVLDASRSVPVAQSLLDAKKQVHLSRSLYLSCQIAFYAREFNNDEVLKPFLLPCVLSTGLP